MTKRSAPLTQLTLVYRASSSLMGLATADPDTDSGSDRERERDREWYPGLKATGAGLVTALGAIGERAGCAARSLDVGIPVSRLLRGLAYPVPDLVMPCLPARGASRAGGLFSQVALLELMGYPHLFAPAQTVGLCRSKGRFKAFVHGIGLPTASYLVLDPQSGFSDDFLDGVANGPPWLLKPDDGVLSRGISRESILRTREEIPARLKELWRVTNGAGLLEDYLPGREFKLEVLDCPDHGPIVLPLVEVVYEEHFQKSSQYPMITSSARTRPGSPDDRGYRLVAPARGVSRRLREELAEIAVTVFRASGCRDAAEIDVRCNADGAPQILEMHPIPDITPASAWSKALRASGRGLRSTWDRLIRQALDRHARTHSHNYAQSSPLNSVRPA